MTSARLLAGRGTKSGISWSARGVAEPAVQRRLVIGGGGPGNIAVGPDQHGTDAGEFAGVSGQLRGHGVQAVRETGVTGGGGTWPGAG